MRDISEKKNQNKTKNQKTNQQNKFCKKVMITFAKLAYTHLE